MEQSDPQGQHHRRPARQRGWGVSGVRFVASAFVGVLAFLIAKESGVPVWRDWEIGDAADIGVTTTAAVYYLLLFFEPRTRHD